MLIKNVNEREEFMLWRKRNRVRLRDVAKYINCSIPTLSRWESGDTNISQKLFVGYREYIEKFNAGEIHARNF